VVEQVFTTAVTLVLLVVYSMDLYIVLAPIPYKSNGILKESSHQSNNTFSNPTLITDPPPITCWHRRPYFWIDGSSTP
ncbi:hypothetical protein EV426DRAFT_596859, partial [Tirmania nivea]